MQSIFQFKTNVFNWTFSYFHQFHQFHQFYEQIEHKSIQNELISIQS